MRTQLFFALLFLHRMNSSIAWIPSSKTHPFVPCRLFSTSHDTEGFDFSSSRQWESFYRNSVNQTEAYEWHSSLSPSDIVQHVPDGPILMIGCGNSRLPDYFSNRTVTLLDSSPTCMDVLRKRYAHEENFDFVCGDVLSLGSLFSNRHGYYAAILDKGLMDAFLCGDDWDNTIQRLMEQSSLIFNGTYVLVSYRLPSSTQAYLQEAGEKYGLGRWNFHATGSNDRVGISLVTKDRDCTLYTVFTLEAESEIRKQVFCNNNLSIRNDSILEGLLVRFPEDEESRGSSVWGSHREVAKCDGNLLLENSRDDSGLVILHLMIQPRHGNLSNLVLKNKPGGWTCGHGKCSSSIALSASENKNLVRQLYNN